MFISDIRGPVISRNILIEPRTRQLTELPLPSPLSPSPHRHLFFEQLFHNLVPSART